VEGAYPTFVLFKKCAQVGKVVGLKEDDLERIVQRAIIS
jgi:thioredoxin 1